MIKDILVEKVNMYCPFCDKEHLLEKRQRKNGVKIKDETIEYEEEYLRCNETKEEENEFVTAKMMDENLLLAKDNYRKKKGLLTSQEIKKIRKKYQLTQSEFSQLLGFGEVTITRYETKLIQDEAYDNIIRLVNNNAMIALEYLQKNKINFKNENRYDEIKNNITKMIVKETYAFLNKEELKAKYVEYLDKTFNNGYKVLDIDILEALVQYISQNYNNLYKVKLMKILWYIDFLYYKENNHSLTGLVYVHQRMGALPVGYDEILKLESLKVEEEIAIYDNNVSTNYHVLPNMEYKCKKKLSNDIKKLCDNVINKFKDWKTKDVVEYMHKEVAYQKTGDNEIINYNFASEINF